MSLGSSDLARLERSFVKKSMAPGKVLHRPGAPIKEVYFPLAGMVAVLTIVPTGEAIETAIIGRDGVIGASVVSTIAGAPWQTVVRSAGSALQIQSSEFLEAWKASEPLRILVGKIQAGLCFQAQQSVACQAFHSMEARLCRWLLQAQDIAESDAIPFTQESLSQALGIRRDGVPLFAATLEAAGLIRFSRGAIKILDRAGLKETACECYEVIHDYVQNLLAPSNQPT